MFTGDFAPITREIESPELEGAVATGDGFGGAGGFDGAEECAGASALDGMGAVAEGVAIALAAGPEG